MLAVHMFLALNPIDAGHWANHMAAKLKGAGECMLFISCAHTPLPQSAPELVKQMLPPTAQV